jgi:hypothetical protein
MPDKPGTPPSASQVRAHLHTISLLLREKDRLDPEAQALLADLVEELGKSLEEPAVPSVEMAKLAESTAQLVQAVHHGHEPNLLEAARNRLDRAVIAVESEAPVLAGLTRRLAQMLADLGI